MTQLKVLMTTFARYLMVGFFNTILSILVMYITATLGFSYLEYTAFGYIASMMLSFFMNLRYTFRVTDEVGKRLILFWSVNLCNLLLVEGIEYSLVEYGHMPRLEAVFCGMCWYVITGFLLNNFLVYRRKNT